MIHIHSGVEGFIQAHPQGSRGRYYEAMNRYSEHYQLCKLHDPEKCCECRRMKDLMLQHLAALGEAEENV